MNWIKNRYDQLILAVVAVALLVFAGMVVVKTGNLRDQLSEVAESVPSTPSDGVVTGEPFSVPALSATASPVWTATAQFGRGERGSPFPPGPPICVGPPVDSLTGKPVSMAWFLERNVPMSTGPSFLLEDSDQDGFTNEDEWRENTDPMDRESHPPYHTKLFLKQVTRTPFRLLFSAINGDARKPESMEFQVNTIDLRQPTAFLKIGEVVPNTGLRVSRFETRERRGLETADVSELTLTNLATDESVILVIGKVANVPVRQVVFDYQWPGAAGEIPVKEGGQFGLRPSADRNLLYQVRKITDTEVVIRLPNGQQYTVRRDPRRANSTTPKPPPP